MKHARRYDLRHDLTAAPGRRPGRHRLALITGGRVGSHRAVTEAEIAERGRRDEQLERSA